MSRTMQEIARTNGQQHVNNFELDDQAQAISTFGAISHELAQSVYSSEQDRFALVGAVALGANIFYNGPYGTGKTYMAKSLAKVLGGKFGRFQGTDDLLASDITGNMWFNMATKNYEFRKGPIFSNVTLADELPRTSKKAQKGLFEALEEGQVTPPGSNESYYLPSPRILIATGNTDGAPVEKGIRDRFQIGITTQAQRAAERTAVRDIKSKNHIVSMKVDGSRVEQLQNVVQEQTDIDPRALHAANMFIDMVFDQPDIDKDESLYGGSRGFEDLIDLARVRSLHHSTDGLVANVEDVIFAAHYVLGHKVVPTEESFEKGVTSQDIIARVSNQYLAPQVAAR